MKAASQEAEPPYCIWFKGLLKMDSMARNLHE